MCACTYIHMHMHIDSYHREGQKEFLFTNTCGNDSMLAVNGNYACLKHFVPEATTFVSSRASCRVKMLDTIWKNSNNKGVLFCRHKMVETCKININNH